ncbi:MAG: nickel-dependent lactate racemase [Syntrophomonas sp.]|nr:nickel-dependent lactate racemase [Syntrophomonas sp.]
MKLELAYGKTHLPVEVDPQQLLAVLQPLPMPQAGEGTAMVVDALRQPLGTERLEAIINRKQARRAVIIVNDITRPTPYEAILPPLLAEIEAAGISSAAITLIIATGIHRPHTEADNKAVFGEDICRTYHLVNHNPDDNLASLGPLSNGLELVINRGAAEADLLVTTGVVGLHYFAGYSGGRKSILPGIASRAVIEANHKMMSDPRACLGNYQDNPVSDLMLEAAQRAGVDFILNVVTGAQHDIAFCAAGDVQQAWLAAVKFCEQMTTIPIQAKADVVLASCGGYPKDINMYQAQKALDAAALAVKPGGTIILAAECREGLGEEVFADWMEQAACRQDIVDRFHRHFQLGGHKAYAICRTLDQADIILVSSMPPDQVRGLFMSPAPSLDDALRQALERYGNGATILVMPEASKLAVKATGFE